MSAILSTLGWLALGLVIGGGAVAVAFLRRKPFIMMMRGAGMPPPAASSENVTLIATLMQGHFAPTPLTNLTISERKFPFRVRADLQRAIDSLFSAGSTITHFSGIRKEYAHDGLTFSDCVVVSEHGPAVSVPPQYEDVAAWPLLGRPAQSRSST